MRFVIAGGHGKIARQLERLLVARGDEALGIVRNPDHVADLEGLGASAVVMDLEKATIDDVAEVVRGAHVAVFAAGAGPGSGKARKKTVDEGAAVMLVDAARAAGVDRFLMVSSIGADGPATGRDDVFAAYLEAKSAADRYLRLSSLDWTIIRPGGLTDEPATGLVTLAEKVDRASITRRDVAALLLASADTPSTIGKQFEATNGETPIDDALAAL